MGSTSARWGAVSHTGTVRSANQDSLIAGPRVFVVADGMGGHASGDVASAIAVARFAELDAADALATSNVLDVVTAANTEILAQGGAGSGREGMGTTVAGIAFVDGDGHPALMAFNVGDSRIYRLSSEGLVQVSVDHSVVAELVRSGRLDPDAAATHPERHVITRALGSHESPDIDYWMLEREVGDRYLICSDGLTNEVPDSVIEQLLGGGAAPQEAADALLVAALKGGAKDNVSAVVVDVIESLTTATHDSSDTNPRHVIDDTPPVVAGLIEKVPGVRPQLAEDDDETVPLLAPVIVDVPFSDGERPNPAQPDGPPRGAT